MIDDLWAAAGGCLSVDEVVARHGYHGPDEGQVSSWSWREDAIAARGAARPLHASSAAPLADLGRRGRSARGRARLRPGCPRSKRAQARARASLRRHATSRCARSGKAAFLQCIDVGRHAAHRAGRLARRREALLDEVDDVRFLTVEELVAGEVDPAAGRAPAGRAPRRAAGGRPARQLRGGPRQLADRGAGRRVDTDGPVCRGGGQPRAPQGGRPASCASPTTTPSSTPATCSSASSTDPGWTPLFAVVGAVVIDIGGPLSHGAIVAREIGIPCVIGTGDGTRRIPDGEVVQVDGDRGEVTRC